MRSTSKKADKGPLSKLWARQGPLAKAIVAGGAVVFAGRLLYGFSELASVALLSRLLSPDEVGAYLLTLSIVNGATTIGLFGSNRLVVPLLAKARTEVAGSSRGAVRSVLVLGGVGVLIVSIALQSGAYVWLMAILSEASDSVRVHPSAAVAAVVWCLAMAQLIAEIFRGLKDLRFAVLFSGTLFSVANLATFAALKVFQARGSLDLVFGLLVLNSTITALIAGVLLWRRLRSLPHGVPPSLRRLLPLAVPFLLTGILALVSTQLDLWVLGISTSQETIAVYGAALKLSFLVSLPLIILNGVLPPYIAELHTQERTRELEWLLRGSSTLAFVFSGLLALLLLVWSGTVLEAVYGSYYARADSILRILILGHAASVFAGSSGVCLLMTGRQRGMVWIALGGTVFVLAGSVALVGALGALGVAMAVSGGIMLQNVAQLVLVRKSLGIWTHCLPPTGWRLSPPVP